VLTATTTEYRIAKSQQIPLGVSISAKIIISFLIEFGKIAKFDNNNYYGTLISSLRSLINAID
jgi:hypothetical protein